MFALVDCNNLNNFYASCERLFRPDLRTVPVIVLSNNDGCVVVRSNVAKALGIKIGVPFFEVKAFANKIMFKFFHGITPSMGIYPIEGVIEHHWPETEIYSIDEAFLNLNTLPQTQINSLCLELQKTLLKNTGIPVSIGIGRTKTLAKVANYVAKKRLKVAVFAVFNVTNQEKL